MSSFSELIELVNVANPDAQVQLTVAMVTVKSVAKNEPLVNGRNTTTILAGITTAGVTGEAPVYYDRLHTPTIFAGITVQLELSDQARTTAQIVQQLNARYGTTFEAAEFVDKECPADAVSYDLEAKAMAIKFTGVLTIALLASLTMAEVVKVPTLVGFNYPVNAVVGGLRPAKIGDIIFTANSELTLAGNTYQLLSLRNAQELERSAWPVLSTFFPSELSPLPTLPQRVAPWSMTTGPNGEIVYVDENNAVQWLGTDLQPKAAPKVVYLHAYGNVARFTNSVEKNYLFCGTDPGNSRVVVQVLQTYNNGTTWGALTKVFEGEDGDRLINEGHGFAVGGESAILVLENTNSQRRVFVAISKNGITTWTRIEVPAAEVDSSNNFGDNNFIVGMSGQGNYFFLTNGKKMWRLHVDAAVEWANWVEYALPEQVRRPKALAVDWGATGIALVGTYNAVISDTPEHQGHTFRTLEQVTDQGHPIDAVWKGATLYTAFEYGAITQHTFPKDGGGSLTQGGNPSPQVAFEGISFDPRGALLDAFSNGYAGKDALMVATFDQMNFAFHYKWFPVGASTFTVPAFPGENFYARIVADPVGNTPPQ